MFLSDIAIVLGLLDSVSNTPARSPQVVGDCGNLPLSLGLAAPLLKGPPQDPKSWRTLHEALNKAMTTRLGTDRIMTVPKRVDAVLEVSWGAMADDPAKQKRCLFLAVLAPGTLAPSDMLEDLWDEVRRGGVRGAKGSSELACGIYLHPQFCFVDTLVDRRAKACLGPSYGECLERFVDTYFPLTCV